MVRNGFFRFLAVAVPGVAVLVGLPLAFGPFSGDPRGVFGPYFLTALPVYAALLSAPGYLSCAFSDIGARQSGAARRWWIRGSLLLGGVAALAGVWGATLMFLFGPPALLTLFFVVVLGMRFERAPGPGQGET